MNIEIDFEKGQTFQTGRFSRDERTVKQKGENGEKKKRTKRRRGGRKNYSIEKNRGYNPRGTFRRVLSPA